MGEIIAPDNRKGLRCEHVNILYIGKFPYVGHLTCYGFRYIGQVVIGEKPKYCIYLHPPENENDTEYCIKRRYEP